MRSLPRDVAFVLVSGLVAVLFSVIGAEFRAVVDDVVTPKVVSAKVSSSQPTVGMKCKLMRGNEEIGQVVVKSAGDICVCKVLSGTPKVGDILIEQKKEAGPTDRTGKTDGGETADAFTQPKPDDIKDPVLRNIALAEGRLLLVQHVLKTQPNSLPEPASSQTLDAAQKRLAQIYWSKLSYWGGDARGRVVLSLGQQGETSLAGELAPELIKRTPDLPPILPDEAMPFKPYPHGTTPMLINDPDRWILPQFWGQKPIDPVFSGWEFDEDRVNIAAGADALARKDIVIADAEVSGEVLIRTGQFLFLMMRSEVLVKFHSQASRMGVSLKTGYNNLHMVSAPGDCQPLEPGRWYPFKARLQGRELIIHLEGKEVLRTTVEADPELGGKIPPKGLFGLGTFKASGSFRKLRIRALDPGGRQALNQFVPHISYKDDGKAIDLLKDGNEFVSLYGTQVNRHRRVHHSVTDGVLKITGSAYSQFSVKGIEAKNFRVTGKVRILEEGHAWLRVNQRLLFGLNAHRKEKETDEGEHVFYVKHTTANFHSYDEGFTGTALEPNNWYRFELTYHHPIGEVKINGETVMVSRTPSPEKGQQPAKNQFGVSAYNVPAEFTEMTFQRIKVKPQAGLAGSKIKALVAQADAELKAAVALLKDSPKPGATPAREILLGKRANALAGVSEYQQVAEELRKRNNWPLYLRVLQANTLRFKEGTPERKQADSIWKRENRKFEVAQQVNEPGDIGLDNLIRTGRGIPAVAVASTGSSSFWIHVPANNSLQLFDAAKRQTVRKFDLGITPSRLLDRGDYLIAITADSKTICKFDAKTGREVNRLEIPNGKIIDWVANPKAKTTFYSVNENEPNEVIVGKYVIYALDEERMSASSSGGFGMFLGIDPHGRYLYSGLNVEMGRFLRRFDPSPLRPKPVNSRIDHLACFQIQGSELSQLNDRPAPGVNGRAIITDPNGRMVCYLATGGFLVDRNRKLLGKRVAAFRAGRVTRTINSFDAAIAPKAAAFNPRLPVLYIFNGRQIRTLDSHSFELRQATSTPAAVKPSDNHQLVVSNDGRFALVTFGGNPGGAFVWQTPAVKSTDRLLRPIAKVLTDAKAMRDAGKTNDARRLLDDFIAAAAFTPDGEKAALELERTMTITATPTPLLTVDLAKLKATPPPKEIKTPKMDQVVARTLYAKYENHDEYTQLVDDLRSYRSLAKQYPASWFWLWRQATSQFTDDPDLLLLAAEQSLALGRKSAATAHASALLKLTTGKGWYAVKAYGILAKTADDPKVKLAARTCAVQINPRSPFTQRRLGDAYLKLGFPEHAAYHHRLSLHLFPSQPTLRANLVKRKLIPPQPAKEELRTDELYKRLAPSVTLIRQRIGAGSGFFITRDGLLLTNDHVITGGEKELKVFILDQNSEKTHELPARVVATSPHLDIAILAVELGKLEVRPVDFAGNDTAVTGMKVIAIGNPGMGTQVLARTVTEGIISHIGQKISGQTYIQTDAAVNPGNSGGPLLNTKGEVIGMITLKARLDNVGFAIPVKRLVKFLEDNLN